MTTTSWFILIGWLLLARGLATTSLSRLPFTSSTIYLGVGLLLGPMVLDIFAFNARAQSHLLETLTEIAVLISLFSAGVKMPVPVTRKRWGPPVRLHAARPPPRRSRSPRESGGENRLELHFRLWPSDARCDAHNLH